MSQSSDPTPGAGLARSFRGYEPAAVERRLRELSARCESAERERDDLRKRLSEAENEAAGSRELERTLRNTLVIAQRSADELKEQSRLEAGETLAKAQADARGIVGQAEATREAAKSEARGIVGEAEATREAAKSEARGIVGEAERRADLLRAEIKVLEERERETRTRFSELLRNTLAQLEGAPESEAETRASSLVDDLRPSADRTQPSAQS